MRASRGHVLLIGLMGSGKSTVGRVLADRLGRPLIDNDDVLRRRTGRSARDIQADAGPDALHRAEADALVAALAAREPSVITAAAGAVLEPGITRARRGHTVVYLRADPRTLARRVAADNDSSRPLDARRPEDVLREQFAARDDAYRELASVVVDATDTVDDIVQTISAEV